MPRASMTVTAYVIGDGPLFDQTADEVLDELRDKIAHDGAQWALEQLEQVPMDKTGRARGGFQENLRLVKRNAGWAVPAPMISGVVWGPWLEGTSKRNASTRFKGYHLFRDVRRQLQDGKAQEIADKALEELLPKLGGD